MSELFINERVMVQDFAIPKYPHLKGIEGRIIDERRLPPLGRHLVTRFEMGRKAEFNYMLPDEIRSIEGTRHTSSLTIKAISLWQPWATLVALGEKVYETRHWSTNYRGLLAIHAAKRWTKDEQAITEQFRFSNKLLRSMPDPLPLGAVLCIVRLKNVRPVEGVRWELSEKERLYGNYANGRYAWQLELVEVFKQPIPAKGAQGFFNWTKPEVV